MMLPNLVVGDGQGNDYYRGSAMAATVQAYLIAHDRACVAGEQPDQRVARHAMRARLP
ncbi:MAG: hypothetical protein JXA36_02250 [Coriobacteriia bacterium]|nr:hypothetical protein [Coriobacteriia bacterium]